MDNKELLQLVDKKEKSGMEITRQWHDIFAEGMRYFFSCHDSSVRKHADWDYVILNYVWPSAIQEIAKLSKNNPKIYANGFEESDNEAAEVWQGATQWQWENQLKMRINMIAECLCAKIFGYSVSKVVWKDKLYWDDQKKQWQGDVQYRLWHPCQFWSNARENIQEGDCGSVRWLTLDDAVSQWPQFKNELTTIAVASRSDEFQQSYGSLKFKTATTSAGVRTESEDDETKRFNSAENLMSLIDNAFAVTIDDTKYVRISEVYLKDGEEKHIKNEQAVPVEQLVQQGHMVDDLGVVYDPSGAPLDDETWPKQVVAEYDEPVYPNGRVVLSAGEGENRILLNEKEQVWQLQRWPFVVKPHYTLPFMWQGLNAVSLYKSTQDMINISVTHMMNNLKQFGDPRIAIEDGALAVDPKHKKPWSISAAAGAVIRLVRGGLTKMQILPAQPVSPAAMQMYNVFAQEYKNLTGLQGISQGQESEGDLTATEAQYLAVSSNDRIALQSVFVDEWVKEVATLIAETMQAYYDEGRFVRIVGGDSAAGVKSITSREKSVRFDILIEPGVTLPFDEEKQILRYREAYQMLASGAVNPLMPDMLRILKIPNWKKLLSEYPEYQKYISFRQMLQGVNAGQMDPRQALMSFTQMLQPPQQGPMQGQPPQQGGQQ